MQPILAGGLSGESVELLLSPQAAPPPPDPAALPSSAAVSTALARVRVCRLHRRQKALFPGLSSWAVLGSNQ